LNKVIKLSAAVIGGDSRQIAVAEGLADLFEEVRLYGHPEAEAAEAIRYCGRPEEAIDGAGVVVLPITGLDETGRIRSYQGEAPIEFGPFFERLAPGTLLVAGSLAGRWREAAAARGIQVLEYADDDEIAILNSIPTAEGAVQIAMEQLPVTIHGSTVLVVGLGRVGVTVARTFKALGARVIVSARKPARLARAVEMGCEIVADEDLSTVIGGADVIVNSVPALVLTAELLELAASGVVIIDLASAPGGVDFEAASRLNLNAKLYPGLPGIVAPETAGAILASAIPRLIWKNLERTEVAYDAVCWN
jgi:dipicolinate synthase subunit A